MTDISTSVSSIILKNAPVLFIDTCSLLDVIILPMRKEIKISHLEGAKEILKKQQQNKISTLITATIEKEYSDHLSNTCSELERYISRLALDNDKMINCIESIGLKYELNAHEIRGLNLSDHLKQIIDEIISASYIIDNDDECIKKAFARVETHSAPSTRGKSESKDCVIIEHFIKIAKQLRDQNFLKKVIFISSNKADYGKSPNLKLPLDTQFQDLQIDYYNNFKWAVSQTS